MNKGHPGTLFMQDVLFVKAFLSLEEQRAIYDEAFRIEPGFYVPKLWSGASMKLLMNCLGYHWSSVSYKYAKARDVDGRDAVLVPELYRSIARRAALETGFWQGPLPPYDICIVNWYDENEGKLGVHADNSESAESLAAGYPVVSLSIGASCVFTIGGLKRKETQEEFVLESGDLVLFGRSMRLAYHGVKKILPGTTPAALKLREAGRLNLTLRIL